NGDLKKAQDLLKKIIDRANVTQAENYDNLGTAYYFDEKLKEALPMYTEALRLYRKTNNKKKIAEALNMMGIITGTLGEPQQALKHHREALEIHRKIGYEQGTANQLGNIGVIYSDPGEPQKALQYLNESLTIFKRIEARPQIDKASNIIEKLKRKISQSK
ncbi:MAG: tetratricopeptide repeat protein, partial [bacterium]|nr:tetratricopeptide repeat protein [bacterium]